MIFSYKNLKLARNRDDVIVDLCRGKRVLHIGAADSPHTKDKFASGLLLHKRLSDVTVELLGIDLDEDAVSWLNAQGLPNIRIVDMNDLTDLGYRPEIIVFGETIEHVVNLGSCIQTLKSCMGADTKLIISTPNCFHLWFASMVFRNYEEVHDDHKVGFTYGLLHQLLKSQNLSISDFYFTFLPRSTRPIWRRIWHFASTIRPGFAETLLAICQLKQTIT